MNVKQEGEAPDTALKITITPKIDGRLIVFELENSGRINTYFPNDRTPEGAAIVTAGQTVTLPEVALDDHSPSRRRSDHLRFCHS